MKGKILAFLSFLVFAPCLSMAEDEGVLREIRIGTHEELKPGDALFLFSRDLAELQAISEAVRYISYAQTSDEEYQKLVEEQIRRAMKKLYGMMETHANSPIVIRGYSVDFPFEITVDFEIHLPE